MFTDWRLYATFVVLVLLVLIFYRRIKHGSSCCGEHEGMEDRIRPSDLNPSHYAYHYILQVEGMVCSNCARKVENAFHKTGEMLAHVDLGKKEVTLHSSRILDRKQTADILDEAGYTLMDFKEEA
ncbi:MAG: hypothetical protein K6G12_08230 [Lachnospiraceae bacterium]|nr:hypothetical protein [Lachnospiraceae bacterium]